MQDTRYRTCVWCYRQLGNRRVGRFCSLTCEDDSAMADRCEYCGEPAQARDHVVPRAFRRALAGTRDLSELLSRMPDTVPACHECNGIAGADVFDSLEEKRAEIQGRLAHRYRRVMGVPAWTDRELATCDGRLRESLEAAEHKRRVLLIRLSWPGNVHTQCRPPAGGLVDLPVDLAEPAPDPVRESVVRRCKWCGSSIGGRRTNARYCSDDHRVLAWQAKNTPVSRGRPRGVTTSYFKAVDEVAVGITDEFGIDPSRAAELAREWLHAALSPNQYARLGEDQ